MPISPFNVGGWLANARKRVGMTQSALATAAGLSRQAIVAIEAGAGSVQTIERIAPIVSFKFIGVANGRTIATQLTNARRTRRLSQVDLADQAGISVPTVRALERGGGTTTSLIAVLNVLAPGAHQNQLARPHWHVRDDVRFTPPSFLQQIMESFGPFSIDVAADPRSFVQADRYITEEEDGLKTAWSGDLAWCNPPFSDLSRWLGRCADAWDRGEVGSMIGLFPARTEAVAFRRRITGVADVIFLPRRMKFFDSDRNELSPSPFALMLCIWNQPRDKVLSYLREIDADVLWADDVRKTRLELAGYRPHHRDGYDGDAHHS